MRVLVTDAEERGSVGAARCLHAAGYDVVMVAAGRPAAGHWSTACTERLTLPSPVLDPRAFVSGLADAVAGTDSILLPGGDASLCAISRHRSRLEPGATRGFPPHAAVERTVDKLALIDAAAFAGLPCPPTVLCARPEAAVAVAAGLGFPLVVKPRRTVFAAGETYRQRPSRIVWNEEQLAQRIGLLAGPFLLQQHELGQIHSCSGVLAGGRLLAFTTSRYWRTFPPDGGPVSFGETIEPPPGLAEKITALVSTLGWQGLFEVELVRHADGTFSAIDVNPRVFGSMSLVVGAGAGLPVIWCDWLRGHPRQPVTGRGGVRYRWEDADARHLVWQLRHHDIRAALAVARPHRHVVHALFRVRDPGPFVARLLYMARVRTARWRRRREVKVSMQPRRPLSARSATTTGHAHPTRVSGPRVAVIGVGPYGLAAAAHLRAAGVETLAFGRVMEFWHAHMPDGMVLRSRVRSSSIADPERRLSIPSYSALLSDPMHNAPLESFLEYAHWFQEQAVPEIDPRTVTHVDAEGEGFTLTLEDGERLEVDRVVVAAGLAPFAWRPPPFDALDPSFVSHSSDHVKLGTFAGQEIVVIGRGQSALESAALLHEAGADVQLLTRAQNIRWLASDADGDDRPFGEGLRPPTDVGGRATGWITAYPDAFRSLPAELRSIVAARCTRPAGAAWLRPRLAGVPITMATSVVAVRPVRERLLIEFDDGTERLFDHALLGTGYRVDIGRYPFLGASIRRSLDVQGGYPRLGPGLESSVPGLHFLGAPAALSFGPIMRFVVGTWYAAPALTRRVQGQRPVPMRRSY